MFSLFFELSQNFCICLGIGVNSSMATRLIIVQNMNKKPGVYNLIRRYAL